MSIDENWFENERLHRAAAEGNLEEMGKLLMAGYGIDIFDELGLAPLHYAVQNGCYGAAQWLIAQGANVNGNDEESIGETPLALAVGRDNPEMVELLLKHGADPDITGWMANTARDRAVRRQDEDGRKIAALIQQNRPA
ncbi:MAG: hypothetical protein JWP29_2173 [Rhodoferax sp.]|nr:hypothetical protein [Rhodoferax sp.]